MNTFFFDDVQYPEGLFGGKDFFNPIIYSTEEREVGVGENNKPLYQITIPFDLNSDTYYIDLSIYDVENVVYEEGYLIHNNGLYKLDLPYYESNTYKAFTNYVKDGRNAIAVYSTSSMIQYYHQGKITIQYTKTTDVAGSASYTTLGVPAHHYDGNEKIIGTWFGETLYERTFSGLATNTNGDNWVNIGGIDASTWKDAVNVEIYCNSSDTNNKLTRIALGEARVFNGNVQVTTSVSYNREITVATIQYTKTS